MADEKIERKLAVIFATDVVGFSTAMETNETETLKSLRACKEILNKLFEEHSGRIFNTAGDSVWLNFKVQYRQSFVRQSSKIYKKSKCIYN